MTSSTKFDFPSSFSDGSAHPNGQRVPHAAPSLERPGSFREGNENRISSSLTSTSRAASLSSQTDGISLLQTLVSDLKTTVLDQKLPRPGEMRRSMTSILGISAEDSLPATFNMKPLPSSSVEEIKRLKSNLLEGTVKARGRAKVFGDAALKMDKFHNRPPRKRSRNDSPAIDRSHGTLPGGSSSKMCPQSHLISSSMELGPQNSEERAKNAVPNRRMRTSLVEVRMDARSNSITKQSGPMDKDRDMLKLVNGGATQSEEKGRGLPTIVDGWEKSKMKKKRSVIKSDATGGAVLARLHDNDRELKRGMQQKLLPDSRQRLNNNHGFRPNSREDNRATSPTPVMKMNTSVRGPRSNPGSVSKAASPDMSRVLGDSDDWEHPQCMNKPNGLAGVVNRKRSTSVRSSSPPVAQWAGQRPQKMTRVARRSNLPPVVSSRDEYPASEMHDSATIIDDVLGFPRRLSVNASQQSKSKGDQVLSESEDSGLVDNKSKDKSKKCNENEDIFGSSVQKVAALVPSSRKNRVSAEEDQDASNRKHGRIGRVVSPGTSGMTTIEQLHSAATAKQMRSARMNNEKIESKPGQAPSKKWSERKVHTRPAPSVNCGSLDLTGESDDDHDELLAAANAVLNTRKACSGEFWKKADEVFRFLSTEDTDFLSEQIRLTEEAITSTCGIGDGQSLQDDLGYNSLPTIPTVSSRDGYSGSSNGISSFNACARDAESASQAKNSDSFLEGSVRENSSQDGISLCQALLSAFIGEEEIEKLEHQTNGKEDGLYVNGYGSSVGTDAESKSKCFSFQSPGTYQAAERPTLNSYKANNGCVYNDEPVYESLGSNSMLDELGPSLAMTASPICSDDQYNQMSINDRILLELSEIGVYPEPVTHQEPSEDEDIGESINRLTEKLNEQVQEKKRLLVKLGKNVKEARECQQRKLESMAMDELMENAYRKYKACWGPNASGSKNSLKTNKQATEAFIKRTLARYQKFEKTKISCFGEPPFRDMFLSISSHNNARNTDPSEVAVAAQQFAPSRQSDASLTDENRGLVSQSAQLEIREKYPNAIRSINHSSDQIRGTEDPWSTKLKKKELLLDDVVGSALRAPSGLGSSLVSNAKGKRSERDREGKGQNGDSGSRNGTAKIGRQAVSNIKVEKKNKSKPKQKTAHLSASVNDLIGKATGTPNKRTPSAPTSRTKKDEMGLLPEIDAEAVDLSNLQLPEIDVSDFGAHGQDIASWLNIEDDGLHDQDFMGLQIPMDDLSEVL